MYRARIDLRVRQDERDRWEGWASNMGISVSEMIRRAVPHYAQQNPRGAGRRASVIPIRKTSDVRHMTAPQVLSVPERDRSDT